MSQQATRYRFGPYEADLRRHLLVREGQTVPLSPRSFELLVALLERPGKMVSRSRLLDRLWPDRVVTEASLTQAVFTLRKALADHPDTPRFVQTVHRRGYRFIAPVRVISDEPDSEEPCHPRGRQSFGSNGERNAGPGLHRAEVMVAAARQNPVRLRATLAVLVLAGLLVFAGAVMLGPALLDRSASFEAAPAQSPQAPAVAVLPFAILDPDGELQLLAVSLNDLLVTRLDTQPGLLLVKPPAGMSSEASPKALRASAEAAQLDYLLAGRLRHGAVKREDAGGNPGKARLTLTLYELDDAGILRTLPLQSFDIGFIGDDRHDVERFVAARDAIVSSLLSALSPAIGLESPHPDFGEATTPHHAEAYRLYLRALHDVRGATCAGQKAMARLQSSLELDPEFAPAWAVQGWAQYNLVVFCGAPARHYTRALKSADRALELAPHLVRAIALKATVLIETGRPDEAYMVLSEARRTLPWRPDIEFLTAYALRYAGYLEHASDHLETLFARDPVFLGVEGWTPNTLLYQGKLDAFLDWMPAADAPIFHYYRALTRLAQGRPNDARRALESGFQVDPNDPFARLSEALARILAQDEESAGVLLDAFVQHRENHGMRDGEFTYKIAQLYALAGDPEAALDQLQVAVEQGFFNTAYLQRDRLLDNLRDDPRFHTILQNAEARHTAFGRRFSLAAPASADLAEAGTSQSR